jgi:hypothetical protein
VSRASARRLDGDQRFEIEDANHRRSIRENRRMGKEFFVVAAVADARRIERAEVGG